MLTYRNPIPTVDIIIELETAESVGIVLIRRKNTPLGWASPGGFIDYGESAEQAAVREAAEETALKVRLIEQFHVYSDPQRDPRQHTLTTVFIARASGTPRGADDAVEARVFEENTLPSVLAFDHEQILRDYFMYKRMGKRPEPIVGAREPRPGNSCHELLCLR